MADMRAYLKPWNPNSEMDLERLLGHKDAISAPTYPLRETGGLLFPYTPVITGFGGSANYEEFHPTHSNYKQYMYRNSEISDISLTADFTANSEKEAKYLVGALWFCSNATKMNFGELDAGFATSVGGSAGLPPPILKFTYMGAYAFSDVPVIMSSYSYDYGNEIDYVTIGPAGSETFVPTMIKLSITLKPYYNSRALQKDFLLSDYVNGDLLSPRYL